MSVYDSESSAFEGNPNTTTTTTITSRISSSSSSSTGARACVRAYAREEDRQADIQGYRIKQLCKHFEESFDRRCPPVVAKEIGDALNLGMDADLLEAIIDETQLAPRPSWAYARAIIRRCFREQVYTAEYFMRGRGIY